MLLSLSLHHPGARVYGFTDTSTQRRIENEDAPILLDLRVQVKLDSYTDKTRAIMDREKSFGTFLDHKADVMSHALETESDTMFLDADIVFLQPVTLPPGDAELVLSPHFIRKQNTDEVGFYNAGCLWTRSRAVPDQWKVFSKTSRWDDQASLEDLARTFATAEWGREVNVMPWRLLLADEPDRVRASIRVHDHRVCYDTTPLVFVHTHFRDPRFTEFNNRILDCLCATHCARELLIADYVTHDAWRLAIPRQPRSGLYRHANDSFRELPDLIATHARARRHESESNHCWLGGRAVLLYDRPTLEWHDDAVRAAPLVLLGNGDVAVEGRELVRRGCHQVQPWTFWARRPRLLEAFLERSPPRAFHARPVESVFVGNIENTVQEQYRNGGHGWQSAIEEYHCTAGTTHKFSPDEYYAKLASAKYGLALRGYGSKCHREVELLALGTVPLVTPGVTVSSYMEPLEEGVHFLRVDKPQDLRGALDAVDPEQWEVLSRQGRAWFLRNCHSSALLRRTLRGILANGAGQQR
ncbi:MAG: hypothetical protein CME58_12305 [Halieaceae bacterium]|nr:hypothetical protein [Halieaceae bacterium]